MDNICGIDELRVTPEAMMKVATEALSRAKKAREHMLEVQEEVKASDGYWSGAGAEAYRGYFNNLDTDITAALTILDKDIDKLNEIAKNYMLTESANVATTNSLSSDVIF